MSQPTTPPPSHHHTPFWRDVRVLAILGQVAFVIAVALVAGVLYANVTSGMERIGMSGSYGFMQRTAGFEISMTTFDYEPSDSYWAAFAVGVINTILVTVVGIVLATLVGIVMGIAQLSSNWLVAKLAQTYVAIFRNVPLLVQLIFWYQAVFLQMPNVRQAYEQGKDMPIPFYISQRGLYTIGPTITPTTNSWLGILLGGLVLAIALGIWLKRRQDRTGQPSPRFLIGTGIVLASGVVGWLVLSPVPLGFTEPELRGLNFQGGLRLIPEYLALLLALVIYTGAFISENVRAGIQGISKGQKEAARALGLRGGQSMRLVILPQALRIIIPPTTNQYLNLAKNSSLAIAIGFPDLFNVARTISNQTGQAVPLIGIVMLSYLSISLLTSLFMNIYNRSVRLVER
jgi:general L-amino acid transport system permease protein